MANCIHQPDPGQGCDTCGRAPDGWSASIRNPRDQAIAFDWTAVTVDGKRLTKAEYKSIDHLPLASVCGLEVCTDVPGAPKLHIEIDVSKGERLHMFTRHAFKVQGPLRRHISVIVCEVRPTGDAKSYVRLYLHPIAGPILSTRDIDF